MVCIYCHGETHVTNSRLQKKSNSVWRRRRCLWCGAIFSSVEQSIYEQSVVVRNGTTHIAPFERDLLFLSIYDACRHRKAAPADAAALTSTVLSKLLPRHMSQGTIERSDIIKVTSETLKRFDMAAHIHYLAYHPLVS